MGKLETLSPRLVHGGKPDHLVRMPLSSRIVRADREPVTTYEKAVWRLVGIRNDPETTDHTYDVAVKLVADIFWITDTRVRRDVRVAARQIGVEGL